MAKRRIPCKVQISAKAFHLLWDNRPETWPREAYRLMDELRAGKRDWGVGEVHQVLDAPVAAAQQLGRDLRALAETLEGNERRDALRAAAKIEKAVAKAQPAEQGVA